jgi:hypothetical protein
LVWYRLRWPREIDDQWVAQAFRLLATTGGTPIIIEAIGSSGSVMHRLAVPLGRAGSMVQQLRSSIPGLAIDKLDERPQLTLKRAVDLRLSTRKRPLRTDDQSGTSRAVLTALAHLGRDESLLLQLVLARRVSAIAVPNRLESTSPHHWIATLIGSPTDGGRPTDPEVRNALRTKQSEPGWQVVARLGVRAEGDGRQRQLIGQVLGALRGVEAPGVRLFARGSNRNDTSRARVPWRRPLRLNTTELAALSTWPVGPTIELPIVKVGSRLVAPSKSIPSHGREIGEATFPGRVRPLSLLPSDARRHLHALGPSGSGKSTLLHGLIIQDIAAGRGVVVIEPKGDLIAEVLKYIPPERLDDVVVIDPSDGGSRVVGINPLAPAGRRPELVADQLLGVFHTLFADHWGPRTSDILSSALLTLARTPGMTMAALPLLLSNAQFRRRLVARIDDPIGLEPFWAAYESWSETERANAIAPAMRRLRPFLLRPDVRALIGQPQPRFDVRQVFSQRKILLVNLSKGLIGAETAGTLSGLIVAQLWQAALGRAAVSLERRHSCFVYVDEFQDYLNLPTDFEDALAQARGLGVGFVLAHQYMHQLDPSMRHGILANVQSRVAFRLPNDDARIVAAGSTLEPEDFQSLGAFQAYAQLVADGTVQPYCSIQTRLPGEPISDPDVVRAASQGRYGIDRDDIEANIRELVRRPPSAESDDIGSRRRASAGTQ